MSTATSAGASVPTPAAASSPSSPTARAVSQCTSGLMVKLGPTISHMDAKMKAVNERQAELAERLEAENEKFAKSEEQFPLNEMIGRTRAYHEKMVSLKKEMASLGERAGTMKARAMRLQEAKQKEALKREQKRQKEAEREEQLVAKPAAVQAKK